MSFLPSTQHNSMLSTHSSTIVLAPKRYFHAIIVLLLLIYTFPAFFTAIAPTAPLSNRTHDASSPQLQAIAPQLLLTTIPNSEAATGK
jgi:hypothetical protein